MKYFTRTPSVASVTFRNSEDGWATGQLVHILGLLNTAYLNGRVREVISNDMKSVNAQIGVHVRGENMNTVLKEISVKVTNITPFPEEEFIQFVPIV